MAPSADAVARGAGAAPQEEAPTPNRRSGRRFAAIILAGRRPAVAPPRLVAENRRLRQHNARRVRFVCAMTRNIALSRPATSAIAAFLALSTPAAFAQEAPTIPMTPPVAAPTPQTTPTTPGPAAPATATTPPDVAPSTQPAAPAPVIRVPLEIAPLETAPAEAKAAPPPVRGEAPPRAERSARPTAAPARTGSAPAVPPEPAAAQAAETAAPATPPMFTEVAPVADPAPAAADTTAADRFPWELAGGAALLLALGGAGLVLARRRRAGAATAEYAEVEYAEPVKASENVASASDQPWVNPVYSTPAADARSTPAFATPPSGRIGRHQAMAMAGPTPDNPFLTLSRRLKRARFLDRQERLAYEQTLGAQKDMTRKPVSAWEISQRQTPVAPQEQEVRRPEPAREHPGLRPGFAHS